MTRKGKNKNKNRPAESNNPPKKKEPVNDAQKKTPVNNSNNQKASPPKLEENNNPKVTTNETPYYDDDGEEAEWCIHLDESDPREFQNLLRKSLHCITCSDKAHISCIHKDCVKKASSNCCRNLKHLFPHMSQQKHPAFLHHKLQVILCTRCNVRSSLKYFLTRLKTSSKFLTEKIEPKKRPLVLTGIVGYVNFGNTCYMNAILQLLGHCPSFTDYLINFVPPGGWKACSPDIPKTVIQMALDMRGIHSTIRIPFSSPWKIITCVRNELPGFDCFQQQDASEFLRNLLDIVDRDLKVCGEYYKNKKAIGLGNPDDDYDLSMEIRTTKTVISQLFQGVLENQITCHTCGFRSQTTENFLDLSIPIVSETEYEDMFSKPQKRKEPRIEPVFEGEIYYQYGADPGFMAHEGVRHKTDLDSCLDMFFQSTLLHEDNQYSCCNCETLVDATKTTKAKHLPEYILIQLKRFRHTVYGSSKIGKTVEFPVRRQDFGKWTTSGEPAIYELIGIVVHEGRSVEFGHYVTFSKNEIDNIWYKFDDTQVRRLDETHVAECEPYILMYRKVRPRYPKGTVQSKPIVESPYNFFQSKRLFTDKINEAWDVVERHLELLPEPELEKEQKDVPTKTKTKAESTMMKRMKRVSILRDYNTEILSRYDIPLNEAKQHVAALERILEEIQSARSVKSSKRRQNKSSADRTLEAVNMLVGSIEKWLYVIMEKEWRAQQDDSNTKKAPQQKQHATEATVIYVDPTNVKADGEKLAENNNN